MEPIKRYEHGGMHWDIPEKKTRREKRKQEKEDEEGMIPARFRNRGQAGLDAYILMMRSKKQKGKRNKVKIKKGFQQKQEGHCEGGSCGQFG